MAGFLSACASEVLAAIVGAVVGASVSVPITLRIVRKSNSNKVDQSGARSGGDLTGRDKISH